MKGNGMKKLADGNTAEIFEWDDTRILKLWRVQYTRADVDYEARISRILAGSSLPVPKMYDVIEHDGRGGIVYERIRGVGLLDWIFADLSRFEEGARWLGRLHAMIHNHPTLPDLPLQRERLRHRIASAPQLDNHQRATMLERLEAMPEGNVVCHGDFHPQNVIVIAENQAVIIDWVDATSGSDMADIARTLLITDSAEQPPEILEMFKVAYLGEYARHRPLDEGLVKRWYPIVAAGRLGEGLPDEEYARLLGIVRDDVG
jgi:Ser/Thr protein kinase RdoA (MazF antagonist)